MRLHLRDCVKRFVIAKDINNLFVQGPLISLDGKKIVCLFIQYALRYV